MNLVDLLNKANEGYDDGSIAEYFNPETGELVEGHGDTLAQFIAIELTDTFDSDADDEAQMSEALRAMDMARRDIDGVMQSLERHYMRLPPVEEVEHPLFQPAHVD